MQWGYQGKSSALALVEDALISGSIYKELGPGERISLAKLSVEHLERTNQRFRLAIDISIWQFQIQSGQGGRNPALRTLYYRILKLLGLGISPLFVFDGPYKPRCKRNTKSVPNVACLDNFATKQLLTRLGVPYHDAPGEAEAECALLQKEGIVDAVLSEDVDTMMFGCTMSLRSWTPEGARSGKTPTHVNLYTAESTDKSAGLDSCGMILVALMSGGDYNTEGLPKCGPKIACEAARAGFGRELCQLAKGDHEGWAKWRARLQHELYTNESHFFKQKHKIIAIPETFPDPAVLRYYMRPTVSSSEKVIRLRESVKWKADIDITELRAFVAEAFNWTYLVGAKHFIRSLAPVVLAHKLLEKSTIKDLAVSDLEAKARAEAQYITAIHGRRTHWNTDGSPELRVSYIPAVIVGLDLTREEDGEQADDAMGALEADSRESGPEENDPCTSPVKRRGPFIYDPNQFEKIWMLETFTKLGVPLLVENWEEDMRDPKRFATRKAREKTALLRATNGVQRGAMDQFVKITKPLPRQQNDQGVAVGKESGTALPPSPFATNTGATGLRTFKENTRSNSNIRSRSPTAAKKTQKSASGGPVGKEMAIATSPATLATNPWTLSKRPTDTYGFKSPTRYSALGIYAPNDPESHEPQFKKPSRPPSPVSSEEIHLSSPGQVTTPLQQKHHCEASNSATLGSANVLLPSDNIAVRLPRRQETSKSSPRKKRSPKIICSSSATGLSVTSSANHKNITPVDLDAEAKEVALAPLTAPRVNRRLDFLGFPTLAQKASRASPASETSSLPSPSTLKSPNGNLATDTGPPPPTDTYDSAPPLPMFMHKRGDHNLISLRESLEGAWKHIEPWQAHTAKDVFAGVEVIDLTS